MPKLSTLSQIIDVKSELSNHEGLRTSEIFFFVFSCLSQSRPDKPTAHPQIPSPARPAATIQDPLRMLRLSCRCLRGGDGLDDLKRTSSVTFATRTPPAYIEILLLQLAGAGSIHLSICDVKAGSRKDKKQHQ